MVRTSHVFEGIALVTCIAANAYGAPTVQDFDTPGTPYTLASFWPGDPASLVSPVPPETRFLRLTDSPYCLNSISFDRTAEGLYSRVVIEFDFRIIRNPSSLGEGFGFGLLDTEAFNSSGPTWVDRWSCRVYLEFVGGEAGSNVNVMYYYTQIGVLPIPRETLDLADGVWHHAEVVVALHSDGAAVTVTFDDTVQPVSEFLLIGARPFESRLAFQARTGEWWAANDIDNVRVEYEDPVVPGGWIGLDRWLLLYPLLQSHGCTAGGPEMMAGNWVAPHVIGTENPKVGEAWGDIDFGGAAAASGWGGAELFPEPTWVSLAHLWNLRYPLGVGDRVDFREIATCLRDNSGAYRLQDMEPCTEQTTLVPNGGFERRLAGACELENWTRYYDMCSGPPAGPVPSCSESRVATVSVGPFYVEEAGYDQTILLEPNTEYVLSAYLWNFGKPGDTAETVVDLTDAPYERQLVLTPDYSDANLGYFVYGNFDAAKTGTEVLLRVYLETWEPRSVPPGVAAQWDNIAITRASEFVPPSPIPAPGLSPKLASENALGIAVTYVENRTGANLDVLLCTSSEDSQQIWVNADMVANESRCGRDVAYCDRTYPATLLPGINKIAVLVWNGDGGWNFGLRILRASDEHIYTDADRSELAFLGAATPVDLKFEEGSGTVAHDSSGWGNDGQVVGAEWVPTPLGTGLRFDGGDDYVDISKVGDLSQGTIEAWARTELTAADWTGDREIVSGVLAYDFGTRDGEFFVCFPTDEGPFGLLSGVFPERNRWYHLAARFDGSTWSLYVDGELKSSRDCPYYFSWPEKFVSRYCDQYGSNWVGTIDEVRIHTRALSAEEIRARYQEDIARRVPLFIRGHANGDTELDIGDAIKMCSIMFAGEPTTCRDAIDANDDGELNLADVITVLGEVFGRGESIAEPNRTCGHDETEDTLDCESFPACY